MARIEQSIDVNVPVHAAYDQLTQFEQYPRFLEDMAEVRQIDDTHLHCHTRAGHLDLEWDAEITQQVPDRSIAWRHMHEPYYEGRVELQPLNADKTRVTLTVGCEHDQQILAAYGAAENAMAQRTRHDLARFKMFLENPRRQEAIRGRPARIHEPVQSVLQSRLVERAPSAARDAGSMWSYAEPLIAAWQMWAAPFGLMRKMSHDVDEMFAQLRTQMLARSASAQLRGMNGSAMHPWTPAVEVSQRDERLTISAELPGVKREDIHVSVMPDEVTIEGERPFRQHQEAQQYCRSERCYGPFRRVVALPAGVDARQAAALLRDGVLEISMPVVPQGKAGRPLDVQGN